MTDNNPPVEQKLRREEVVNSTYDLRQVARMLEVRIEGVNKEIRLIQGKCTHKWDFLFSKPMLRQSKVTDVFLCSDSSTFLCSLCSLERTSNAITMCPQCAGEMNYMETLPEGSEKYTSTDFLAHWQDGGEKMYVCSVCTLKIARRIICEWDH